MNSSAYAVEIVEYKGMRLLKNATSINLNDFSDTKFDLDQDGHTDIWLIHNKSQMQIHYLNKLGVTKSIYYHQHRKRLVRTSVVQNRSKIVSEVHLISNPIMNLAATAEEVIGCNMHDGSTSDLQSLVSPISQLSPELQSMNTCSQLDLDSKNKLIIFAKSLVEEKFRGCLLKGLKKFLPHVSNLELALVDLEGKLSAGDDFLFREMLSCTDKVLNGEGHISSTLPPVKIKLQLSNGYLDSKINDDAFTHEYIHLLVRQACLIDGKWACDKLSIDEELVGSINSFATECSKITGGIGKERFAALSNSEVISQAVAESLGAPIATLELESAQGQPVSASQLNELAYLPAAEALGKDPAVLERKTVALAEPMLKRGQQIFNEVRAALGSELDVLPAAGASTRLTQSKVRSGSGSQLVDNFENRIASGSGRKAAALPGQYESGAQGAEVLSAKGGQGKVTQDVPAPELAKNKTGPGVSKEQVLQGQGVTGSSGGLAASAAASGAAATGPGRGIRQGADKSALAASPASAASGSLGNRNPAAIDTKQITPEAVASEVASLSGREVLAKLQDQSFSLKVKKAEIAIFELNKVVHGVDPSKASYCYIIRSLNKKPTPINCAQRRQRQ